MGEGNSSSKVTFDEDDADDDVNSGGGGDGIKDGRLFPMMLPLYK